MRIKRSVAFLILLVPLTTMAGNDNIVRKFLDSYKAGDIKLMPTDSQDVIDTYGSFYHRSKNRAIRLENVRWSDTRITADYYAKVDDVDTQGSLTIFVKDDKITKMVHDHNIYKESSTNVADAGQAADKGTTVVALSSGGMVEANPVLSGLSAAGIAGVGAGVVALRKSNVKTQSLGECIETSRLYGGVGWGAASNNILALIGLGPAALLFGIGSGTAAYKQEYKGSCVEGPVRISSIE